MRIAVLALLLAAACGDDSPAIDAPHVDAHHVDATPDVPIDAQMTCALAGCTPSQQCVIEYGGTCNQMGVVCRPIHEGCESGTCSAACEAAYCESPYQCMDSPCPGVPPTAFGCFGP